MVRFSISHVADVAITHPVTVCLSVAINITKATTTKLTT